LAPLKDLPVEPGPLIEVPVNEIPANEGNRVNWQDGEDIMAAMVKRGISFRVDGDQVKAGPASRIDECDRAMLHAHRDLVLSRLAGRVNA
jgi:hypothetical protein